MARGDRLIQQILSKPGDDEVDELVYALLNAIIDGYPVTRLRPLLSSSDDQVVMIAIWVAAELRTWARPLKSQIHGLLKHRARYVRHYAIESLRWIATDRDGAMTADVISMLTDPEGPVRRITLDFLARASEAQLGAALAHFEEHGGNAAHVEGLRWLIDSTGLTTESVLSRLASDEEMCRKYGVAGAARLSGRTEHLLARAAMIMDDDVSRFAKDYLDIVTAPAREREKWEGKKMKARRKSRRANKRWDDTECPHW